MYFCLNNAASLIMATKRDTNTTVVPESQRENVFIFYSLRKVNNVT
jgi:hypothetical protein